jgi:Helicase subunit of the DNA excision repair complex
MSDRFQLVSPYSPAGDQPLAIEKLVSNFEAGWPNRPCWV